MALDQRTFSCGRFPKTARSLASRSPFDSDEGSLSFNPPLATYGPMVSIVYSPLLMAGEMADGHDDKAKKKLQRFYYSQKVYGS